MSRLRQAPASAAGRGAAAGRQPRPTRLARAVSAALNPVIPILSCALPGLALAAPRGGEIVDGTAAISRPDASTTLIEQSSNRLAIDWQRFSIGADEYVRFVQPDAGALALNRVVGGNPSQILGKLSANGQVFLVNPNGIYFGHGATVDVGGLVASVFDIDTDDFRRGDYVFTRGDGLADGVGVVNDGHISAADGGYVALLGDRVANHGVIATRLGSVALASGRQITLDLDYRGLVSLAVDEAAVSTIAGIHNSGEIAAAGGRVMLRASVANDLIDTVINNEGAIAANSIVERDGVVYLAASGGDIDNSGLLDASAASGSGADGGRVLVHTDADIANAAGATIRAGGDGSGDGGMVRVVAGGHMGHQAGAEIVADSERGRGGLVEVSGHGSLALRGEVAVGAGGELLIDPATLRILDSLGGPSTTGGTAGTTLIGRVFVENQLNNGANVTLVASNLIESTTSAAFTLTSRSPGAGNLRLAIGTLSVASGSLGAGATGNCVVDGFCVDGGGIRFTPGANGSINLSNIGFDLAGGLTVAGGTASGTVDLGNIQTGGDIAVSGANVNFDARGANTGFRVTTPGSISIDAGNLVVAGGSGILTAASRTELHADGNVTINASGGVSVLAGNTGFTTGGAPLFNSPNNDFDASAVVSAGGGVSVTGGSLTLLGGQGRFSLSAASLVTGNLDAAISATDVDVQLSGDLTVSGGRVGIFPGDGSGPGDVGANGVIVAGNDIDISVGGSVNVSGGTASASGGDTVIFDAAASGRVDAGNDLRLVAGSGVTVSAGSASVNASAFVNQFSAGDFVASAAADATLTAGNRADIGAVGATLAVQGGQASATASGSAACTSGVCGTDLAANATVSANANATVAAAVVVIDSVGADLAVSGGNAGINASGASSVGTNGTAVVTARADARADASISGGSAIVGNVGGNLNVADGTRAAVLGANALGSAAAEALVEATAGDLDVNVDGDIVDGSASFLARSGALDLAAGGNFSARGVYSAATGISLGAGGNLTVDTSLVESTQGSGYDIALNGGGNVGFGAVTVQARNLAISGGNLNVSTGNITAFDALRASMSGSIAITGSATNVDAGAVFLSALGDLTVQPNALVVGSGTVSGVAGDRQAVDFVVSRGAPAPTTANPNAKLVSGGVLTLENLTLQAAVPYLWLEADSTNIIGGIAAAQSDLLVQYSPHTLDATIGLESQAAQGGQQVNYGKTEHFDVLPGTTVIIGSSQHSGDIAIGQSGSIDIGGQNLVAVTARRVDGLQNVISSGIVAQLLTAGAVEIPPETPYVPPAISEIEFEQLIRIVTGEEEAESRKRLVSSEEEETNMCEAS